MKWQIKLHLQDKRLHLQHMEKPLEEELQPQGDETAARPRLNCPTETYVYSPFLKLVINDEHDQW